LTGSLLSPTSEMLDPHVLTYWRVRCAKRAATDFLDRREKRRHRVPLRSLSRARASERGAVTGCHDQLPGLADLQPEICTFGNPSFEQLPV
jgi:hypothetical protein